MTDEQKKMIEKLNEDNRKLNDVNKGMKEYAKYKLVVGILVVTIMNIPWWRSHPIHENRATESICTEPCNPLFRATKSMKRATSTY